MHVCQGVVYYVHICGYVQVCASAHRSQNRALDPLELELEAVVAS